MENKQTIINSEIDELTKLGKLSDNFLKSLDIVKSWYDKRLRNETQSLIELHFTTNANFKDYIDNQFIADVTITNISLLLKSKLFDFHSYYCRRETKKSDVKVIPNLKKENTKKRINGFLDCYNDEALNFLELLLETYSSTFIGKGNIMELVLSDKERNKVDSALPHDYVKQVKKILPCFNTFNYVMDYNNSSFGEILNITEALHLKLQTKLNSSNFDKL